MELSQLKERGSRNGLITPAAQFQEKALGLRSALSYTIARDVHLSEIESRPVITESRPLRKVFSGQLGVAQRLLQIELAEREG
jgi:hypothetical protein